MPRHDQRGNEDDMPIWLVRAIWMEDETEASEQWEVTAPTALEAIREATAHIRFQPHHVEAKLRSAQAARPNDSQEERAKRVVPQ
jgi:hypothetical protein